MSEIVEGSATAPVAPFYGEPEHRSMVEDRLAVIEQKLDAILALLQDMKGDE